MNHFSRRREAINNFLCVLWRAGSAMLWAAADLFVSGAITGSYLESCAEVSSSARCCCENICARQDPSLGCHPSFFLLLPCLFPSFPRHIRKAPLWNYGYRRWYLRRLILPHCSQLAGGVVIVVGVLRPRPRCLVIFSTSLVLTSTLIKKTELFKNTQGKSENATLVFWCGRESWDISDGDTSWKMICVVGKHSCCSPTRWEVRQKGIFRKQSEKAGLDLPCFSDTLKKDSWGLWITPEIKNFLSIITFVTFKCLSQLTNYSKKLVKIKAFWRFVWDGIKINKLEYLKWNVLNL